LPGRPDHELAQSPDLGAQTDDLVEPLHGRLAAPLADLRKHWLPLTQVFGTSVSRDVARPRAVVESFAVHGLLAKLMLLFGHVGQDLVRVLLRDEPRQPFARCRWRVALARTVDEGKRFGEESRIPRE
jgi:hypothetical protein